jgi:hypothetical protein
MSARVTTPAALEWDELFEGGDTPSWSGEQPSEEPAPYESFATGATAAVSTLQLRTTIAAIADAQLERWRAGTTSLTESSTWGRRILQDDYWSGIGIPNPGTFFGSATWWSAAAWSAAFVMACARKMQAALQLPNPVLGHATLTENKSHSAYCWQAFQDRSARRRGRYWAFRPGDAVVEVGDIVAKARGATTVASAWQAVTAAAYGAFTSHADVVVRVGGGQARVMGGNVGDTVARTTYALTADGLLDTTVTGNDANLVFAVLKPEGAPFSGRLMGMVT